MSNSKSFQFIKISPERYKIIFNDQVFYARKGGSYRSGQWTLTKEDGEYFKSFGTLRNLKAYFQKGN